MNRLCAPFRMPEVTAGSVAQSRAASLAPADAPPIITPQVGPTSAENFAGEGPRVGVRRRADAELPSATTTRVTMVIVAASVSPSDACFPLAPGVA
jgi:hypothetical protein